MVMYGFSCISHHGEAISLLSISHHCVHQFHHQFTTTSPSTHHHLQAPPLVAPPPSQLPNPPRGAMPPPRRSCQVERKDVAGGDCRKLGQVLRRVELPQLNASEALKDEGRRRGGPWDPWGGRGVVG